MNGASQPWLSLLLPVYNVEPFLQACIDSVLSQIDAGVEVLLLDDCSTDSSPALMQAAAARDARVRCLSHERNSGLSAARNSLLAGARGRYVWFLDSDDLLEPGAIAGLRRIVDAHQPDLVLCDYRMERTSMRLKHRLRGEQHKRTFAGPAQVLATDRSALLQGLFEAGQLHSWSKIARRTLWGQDLRFPIGRYYEDISTTPFLALRARSWWYEPAVWVAYRQRAGSILRTPNLQKAEHMAHALDGLREAAAGKPLSAGARFAWTHYAARNFMAAARQALRSLPDEGRARVASYHAAFLDTAPLPTGQLLIQYLRRGWFWRAVRLHHWLRRSPST